MRYVLLFTILSAISGSAAALTGNELLEYLKQPSREIALGYIEGVVDSAVIAAAAPTGTTSTAANWTKRSIRKWTFCTPTGVTRRQSADVVLQWLEARPEIRHNLAHELVGAAFEHSYPCYR